MTTFSQLVDEMVRETKRQDLVTDIAKYLNQTIRELHMEPQRGNAVFYRQNRKEAVVTANVDSGQVWEIPNSPRFQGVEAVQFMSVYTDSENPYVKEFSPGVNLARSTFGYYRVGDFFCFKGYGGLNSKIGISWFEFVQAHKYYVPGLNPALYDIEDGWSYLPAFDVDDTTRERARTLTSNWMLLRWKPVIEEGLRAKIYKRLSDESRARTSYSMYTTLRQGLYSSEVADLSVG